MENYEKKYKKLVDAVKVLRDNNPSDEGIQNWVNDNVPELKESEDERIRKELIAYFEQFDNGELHGVDISDWIAWLEKQGNKEEPQVYEPKFKLGDYLVNDYCRGKVIALTYDAYLLDTEQCIPFSYEHNAHLWTIQDAKDGDVLVTVDNKHPFIYKGCLDHNHPHSPVAYCGIDTRGYFCVGGDNFDHWWTDLEVQPSAKEQRDLLFQKMKETGYEWNAEKKELKKIGQKPNNSQFTPEQADIIDKHIDNFLGRKSAWSKNDEEMWIDAIKYLELFDAQGIHGDVAVPCMEWLKSLKDRVQPKQEWSEDDKGNMLSVKCVIDKAWHNQDFREDTGYSAEELESLWNWFDNIWQRVKYPQNPWKPSEEQMKWFSDIIDYHQFSTKGQKIMQSLYNDLKKLKER